MVIFLLVGVEGLIVGSLPLSIPTLHVMQDLSPGPTAAVTVLHPLGETITQGMLFDTFYLAQWF